MNNQQEQHNKPRPVISIGAAIILGISAVIVAAIIAGAIIMSKGAQTLSKIDFNAIDGFEAQVDEKGEITTVNVDVKKKRPTDSFNWTTVTHEGYSFQAPENWIVSGVDVEGCAWGSVSNNTGDGHRMVGEIGIYPMSCFDLSNANGYADVAEVDGYYILAYYDSSVGTTPREKLQTKEVFRRIVDTFSVRL